RTPRARALGVRRSCAWGVMVSVCGGLAGLRGPGRNIRFAEISMMLNLRQAPGAIAGVMILVMCAPAAASQEILRSRLVAPAEPLTYFDHTREGKRLLDYEQYSEAAEVLQ